MKKYTILLGFFLYNIIPNQCNASPLRGLWVWNTSVVISDNNETNRILNQCIHDSTTEIFLYANGYLSGNNKDEMQAFITKAACNNIHVWALDGYRGYFADWYGKQGFIDFISSVILYNKTSAIDAKFTGIQGDNEPQDGQGEPLSSFHNGYADSLLNATGGGVWMSTEVLDREYLMQDWLSMTEQAYDSCRLNNMRYGQAMVSWLDDYYGEPVYCTYKGQRKRVMENMMAFLDDYFIMSYNTNPANAFNRIKGELQYAETLPVTARPRVWGGCETHCGAGNNISYCDTPGKNNKTTVYNDIHSIDSMALSYKSYAGYNIHDWEGWQALSPASGNITDPNCLTTLVIENDPVGSLCVYPNPVKEQFVIYNMPSNASIKIFNVLGELISRFEKDESSGTINFTYESGIYALVVEGEHYRQVIKIVKE